MNYTTLLSNGTKLAFKIWKPDSEPEGLIYIAHGLNESFEYYEEFADVAVKRNQAVFMHEARGHGRTAGNPLSEEYFTYAGDAGENAIDDYRNDIYHGILSTKEQYPGLPVTLVAHSLGTIVTLSLLENYKRIVNRVILIGMPAPKSNEEYDRLIKLSEEEIIQFGGKKPSRLVYQEIFSNANERFGNLDPLAFISRDKRLNEEAIKYPFTQVIFNNHFFHHFLKTQKNVYQLEQLAEIDTDLPVLLLTGSEDFVTDYTLGVYEAAKRFVQTSHSIELKIYQGARHSLLREINRKEVMDHILKWSWENKTDTERC